MLLERTAERDALRAQLERLTSDEAVQNAWSAYVNHDEDSEPAMKAAITAAVAAAASSTTQISFGHGIAGSVDSCSKKAVRMRTLKLKTWDGAEARVFSAFDIIGILADYGEKDDRGVRTEIAIRFDKKNALRLRDRLDEVLAVDSMMMRCMKCGNACVPLDTGWNEHVSHVCKP